MKGKLLVSMLVACLPWLAMAQSNDDLYFIPKKKKEEKKEQIGKVPRSVTNETVNDLPDGTTFVVKDVRGNVRDVDEYNRRYTSRDNTFSYQNDTLMVTEKPISERGEWVNGFEGSDMDYEYAMRLVRFKNPRYMIPVSSPMYWEVVNGALFSWDWNVYDDGMYAYVFPTYTNRLWMDWRFSPGFHGPYFGFSFGWYDPWFSPWYSSWYSPWYGGYYGGYWGSYWGGYWGHCHGWGGYYNSPRYHYNDRRGELYGRSYRNSYTSNGNRGDYRPSQNVRQIGDRRGRSGGRVVRGSDATNRSTRVVGGRSRGGVYSRPTMSTDRSNRVYTRPSSTRRQTSDERYKSDSSRRSNSYNYNSGSSSRKSDSSGSFRSGGGSTRHSGGGSVGRSGGGVRRR